MKNVSELYYFASFFRLIPKIIMMMKKVILSILLIATGAIIGISWKANEEAKKRCENQIQDKAGLVNSDITAKSESKQDSAANIPIANSSAAPEFNIIQQYEKEVIGLFKKSSTSVVYITTSAYRQDWSRNVYEIPVGSGSGFIWDKAGHVITNYHVIKGVDKAEVTLSDHTSWPATLVGVSKEKDIAVLKIEAPAEKLIAIKKGRSDNLIVGQFVMAIGNPFGLDHTLTTGVISALGREIQSQAQIPIRDIIQIDAAINPGNSGGPLLNSTGRLIGVNAAIYSPSGASAGIGFAIPVNVVKWVVSDIIKYGEVRRPVLGIGVIPDYRAKEYGVSECVVISYIFPDSPSEKSGLEGTTKNKLGDIILKINGDKIDDSNDLVLSLEKYKPGETVELTIQRDNKKFNVNVVLGTSN